MGQITHLFVEHNLRPDEILFLPNQLKSISDKNLVGEWKWTRPHMDKDSLADLWTKGADYFLKNPCSVADLALLQRNNMTFFFLTSNLVLFDNLLRWDSYHGNNTLRLDFNRMASSVVSLTNAIDFLVVPDLSSVGFYDEEHVLTVDAYRKKAKGNQTYAIELD